jgi:toxin secretion/phage lysis holin
VRPDETPPAMHGAGRSASPRFFFQARMAYMEAAVKAIKAVIGAILALFLSLHVIIQVLVYAIAFDIITGLISAWIRAEISSDVSRRGIGRKALMLIAVAAAELFGRLSGIEVSVPWGGTWGLGAAVAGYYAIHEAISIVENLVRAGVPAPQFIIDRLMQLRQAAETNRGDHVSGTH